MGQTNRKRFLDRIRRIEALNEDTAYRAISSEASEIDAVRVMTIHGSKGLEFRGVHLPVIATGYMPSTRRRRAHRAAADACSRLVMQPSDHEAEEEGLFFVAMSRARDVSVVEHAPKNTPRSGAQTPRNFSTPWRGLVTPRTFAGSGKSYVAERQRTPGRAERGLYRARAGDLHAVPGALSQRVSSTACAVAGMSPPIIRFHRCVYKTVGWLEAERESGNAVTRGRRAGASR